MYQKKHIVLLGDANGADKAMQKYFAELQYDNVIVFTSGEKIRNNIGNWKVENIEAPKGLKGFDFYTVKDKSMAEMADYAFMIWNGESKGTLNNIINMINQNKKSLVYFIPFQKAICINTFKTLEKLLSVCAKETQEIYKQLTKNNNALFVAEEQMQFFKDDSDVI